MATTCPECQQSTTADDYCDGCGARLGAAPTPQVAPATVVVPTPSPPPDAQECASCGAVRFGRFCEECGHDATAPIPEGKASPAEPAAPVAPGSWTAVVRADRAWFDQVRSRNGPDAATLEFPLYCPERRFPLAGGQLMIGRRSRSRGIEPEIDLTGPPLDPGVSTTHALLVPSDDGGWQVVDLESTNGTTVGEGPELIKPNTPVPLRDGDHIKIGAWTTITLLRA